MTVIEEVAAERVKQDEMWGGPAHDDRHKLEDWCELIGDRLDESRDATRYDLTRRKMLAVAALAVAAIESMDRQTARPRAKKEGA